MADEHPVARVPAGIEDMIPGFMENRRKEAAELRALLEAGNFERIAEIAHRMIGVGTPYGFEFITNHARVMRQSAVRRDAPSLERQLEELSTYLRVVKITTE